MNRIESTPHDSVGAAHDMAASAFHPHNGTNGRHSGGLEIAEARRWREARLAEVGGSRPSFFLIGAPRCGTSAMCATLKRHPQVFFPAIKEPHFLADESVRRRPVPTLQGYLDLFAQAPSDRLSGEGSVFYLVSPEAPRRILDFCPDPRIIVMLRNPADQMFSNHRKNISMGCEDVFEFEEALALEPERAQGRRIRPGAEDFGFKLLYRHTATYRPQLTRVFEAFGRDRVHVIVQEEWKRSPQATYDGVCDFLGLDRQSLDAVGAFNENVELRSKGLQRLIQYRPKMLVALGRLVMPPEVRKRLFEHLWHYNRVAKRPEPLDPELRRRLTDEFRPETERLEELLGRDLSHWYRTKQADRSAELVAAEA